MFKRVLISLALFLSVSILYSFTLLENTVQDTRMHGPIIRNKNGTSTNWSGYAALGSTSDVKGTWVVPSLTCGSTNTYSSAWVGIDGYNDGTVEQTGTEHDCSNGVSKYYAWYEMYPKPSYVLPLTINVNDIITSEVKYLGNGSFKLTLVDNTTGKSFSTTQKSAKAQRLSAEWIMEAPYSGGILPLANFGLANYSGSSALINGSLGTINQFNYNKIDMVNSSGQLKDQTSTLSTDGTSFNIQWISSN